MTLKPCIERRGFILWLLGVLAACGLPGCRKEALSTPTPSTGDWIGLGPLTTFKAGWNFFPLERLAVRREGERVLALSMVCTHQTCLLREGQQGGFNCPCHGSNFDPSGKVLNGPALQDLTRYEAEVTRTGEVRVRR